MNLKRSLIATIIVLSATLGFSGSASAGGLYFGINLEMLAGNQDNTSGSTEFRLFALPLPGIEAGYDFGDALEGFGARLSINFLLIRTVSLDAYYRFTLDASGSNAYLGAGYDLEDFSFDISLVYNGLHALAGYEWRFTPSFALFIEAAPGFLSWSGGTFFAATLRTGLVWHL
jgi:hypothetical protein